MTRLLCYKCVHHRRRIAHQGSLACNNFGATLRAKPGAILRGKFWWPISFDPIYLLWCEGFSDKPEDDLPPKQDGVHADFVALMDNVHRQAWDL